MRRAFGPSGRGRAAADVPVPVPQEARGGCGHLCHDPILNCQINKKKSSRLFPDVKSVSAQSAPGRAPPREPLARRAARSAASLPPAFSGRASLARFHTAHARLPVARHASWPAAAWRLAFRFRLSVTTALCGGFVTLAGCCHFPGFPWLWPSRRARTVL